MSQVQAFYVREDLFEQDCPGVWEWVLETLAKFAIVSGKYEFASAVADFNDGDYVIYMNHVEHDVGISLELTREGNSFNLLKLELIYEPLGPEDGANYKALGWDDND